MLQGLFRKRPRRRSVRRAVADGPDFPASQTVADHRRLAPDRTGCRLSLHIQHRN